MLLHSVLFYVFAAIMFGAALGVVFSRNPVHAVMFLVFTFFNAAILWLLAEAEFLAIVLVLVYVGAVMVLFLWFRATFPRYRYDQIMRLGWKVFIPVTIVWIAVEGAMAWFQVGPWAGMGA